jgi:hypothetical protein
VSEWVVWVPVALLTLGFGWLAVALLRDRAQGREQLAAAYALVAVLEERVLALEEARRAEPPSAPPSGPESEPPTYVISRIAEPADAHRLTSGEVDHRIDGSLFADLVLRESMVKGISLAYGVGRALSPETRNRIRFLMRQEVKRSRKQRRLDLRAARRHLADVQRAAEDAA